MWKGNADEKRKKAKANIGCIWRKYRKRNLYKNTGKNGKKVYRNIIARKINQLQIRTRYRVIRSDGKRAGKKSNNINKYRMQFHLENKSLSIDSSWVDCQQNLNRSPEKCHSALTQRTHYGELRLDVSYIIYGASHVRARCSQNTSESFVAQRKFNKIPRKTSENS